MKIDITFDQWRQLNLSHTIHWQPPIRDTQTLTSNSHDGEKTSNEPQMTDAELLRKFRRYEV